MDGPAEPKHQWAMNSAGLLRIGSERCAIAPFQSTVRDLFALGSMATASGYRVVTPQPASMSTRDSARRTVLRGDAYVYHRWAQAGAGRGSGRVKHRSSSKSTSGTLPPSFQIWSFALRVATRRSPA
jgi:hypothetical protein